MDKKECFAVQAKANELSLVQFKKLHEKGVEPAQIDVIMTQQMIED